MVLGGVLIFSSVLQQRRLGFLASTLEFHHLAKLIKSVIFLDMIPPSKAGRNPISPNQTRLSPEQTRKVRW